MSNNGNERSSNRNDAVEALLGQASPRPLPPASDSNVVREAVRQEWLQVTTQRRSRLRHRRLAIAATIVFAVFASLNLLRSSNTVPVDVAVVQKQFGSVRMLGDSAELIDRQDLDTVTAGDVFVTGKESGISLAWKSGGSLRIDESSRIEFLSGNAVFLHGGRVYFDSAPALQQTVVPVGNPGKIAIQTQLGEVTHVGTQFMAATTPDALIVSVREGTVAIDGAGLSRVVQTNQQLTVFTDGGANTADLRPDAAMWAWVERTTPGVSLDGHSVSAFLNWVGREAGLSIEFESEDARSYSEVTILNGQIDTTPRKSLEVWMLGTDLTWRIDSGVLYVGTDR